MKICVAQIRSIKGDIDKNIENHKRLIDMAIANRANVIVFPELSITGYEPELSKELATSQEDKRLDDFQKISDINHITIGVGIPTKSGSGIRISMIIFQPNEPKQTYSKQYLHQDEFPYFVRGQEQIFLTYKDNKIAPAICYESLLSEHSEIAFKNGTNVYLASVAKPTRGIEKAFKHYPAIANKYSMTVLMANCVGYCDNFESVGQSSVWDDKGQLVGQLDDQSEGILVYDTSTRELIKKLVLK
jgi:predicted amidohydrolase